MAAQRALSSEGKAFVTRKDAIKVAKKIKAYKLLECSALTQQGLQNVNTVISDNQPIVGIRGGHSISDDAQAKKEGWLCDPLM